METAATAAQSLPPQATAETGSSNSNSNSGAVIESSLTANSPTVILGDPDEGALRVKIKAARFVASWKWDVAAGDVCGICRSDFEACCPSCKLPGDDCPPMWGGCNHAFHLHCIVKWITAQADKETKECPLCRRPWEEK